MKGLAFILLAASAPAIGGPAQTAPSPGADDYRVDVAMAAPAATPRFVDEFDAPAIDPAHWRYHTSRDKAGWYDRERQYHAADRPGNARIERGAPVIEARAEGSPDRGGQAYSSVKLVTRHPPGYGFCEIRAQLPCGRGIGPAIRLSPPDGRWPDAREIDIMEMVGSNPGMVLGTVHSGAFNHVKGTRRGAGTTLPRACDAMRRHQLDWTADRITIGIDGRGCMRVRNDPPGGAAAWPFARPHDPIPDVAVGGDWVGARGIDDAPFPQAMRVDHVRHRAR